MTFCKIVFTNNQQDVKYFNSPCVWFLILISFDDTWFFELHFRSPVTFHSCTPGKERYFLLIIFSYQSLWYWWQHMNSQRSLGCSWLRFSIGFRPGQIGFLNVSFLKTYWSSDQLWQNYRCKSKGQSPHHSTEHTLCLSPSWWAGVSQTK